MIDNYFRITCVQSSTYIQIAPTGSISTTSIEYRTSDDQTWRSYTLFGQVYIRNGEWVEFRNTSGTFSSTTQNCLSFQSSTTGSPQIEVSGNIMSLLDYRVDDLAIPQYSFHALFSRVTTITKASGLLLPAKALSNRCYGYMFNGCTSLTQAPELPATTLATYCYQYMFNGCSALTKAPKLPATEVNTYCYYRMFEGCSSLTKAPELPQTSQSNCFSYMFQNCSNLNEVVYNGATFNSRSSCASWLNGVSPTGTFYYTNPNLDISTIPRTIHGVPEGWEIKFGRPSDKRTFNIGGKTVSTLYLNGKAVKTLFVDGEKIYG